MAAATDQTPPAAVTPSEPPPTAGRYDAVARRRGQRRGRERGCWVYMPAEELAKAGHDPQGDPPFYRTWGTRSGGVLVRLYRNP